MSVMKQQHTIDGTCLPLPEKGAKEGENNPSTGLTPDALPGVPQPVLAENSQTGVSTKNAQPVADVKTPLKTIKRKPKEVPHWYALRVTYGREKKAYDYLVGKHVEAYYPTIKTFKEVDGKRKAVEESRLPNIFFARGTEEVIKSFVYDNVNLPFLRFYYRYYLLDNARQKEPLIVPDYQMESLKIICAAEEKDVLILPYNVQKFSTGQKVRIIDGEFKNVEGRVARFQKQQRVGIVIEGLLTVATAYIPSAFLQAID